MYKAFLKLPYLNYILAGKNKGLKGKFGDAIGDLKNSDKKINKTLLIIISVLVLIFLYIIDFDLSIFINN